MKENGDRISVRQLSAVAWTAVLAPALGVLPGAAAARAGEGGWLSALLALPLVLLVSRMVWRLMEETGENMARVHCQVLGKTAGRLLNLIYMVWGVILLALRLRLSGQRLLFTGRRDGTLWFFLPVILAAALWMAWGRLAVFARAAEIFFGVLAAALGAVTVLTLFQVRPENLWPLWAEDVLPVCGGAVSALGTLCWGIYAAFLPVRPAPEEKEGGIWNRRLIKMCLALSAVQAVMIGTFGPQLTAQLDDPFVTLSRYVGVEGAFQRVEGLVAALWLYSDLAALALLLWAGKRIAEELCPEQGGKVAAAAGAVLGLIGAGTGFADASSAQRFARTTALTGNLILGFLVPAAVFLIAEGRKRKERGGTSCVSEG